MVSKAIAAVLLSVLVWSDSVLSAPGHTSGDPNPYAKVEAKLCELQSEMSVVKGLSKANDVFKGSCIQAEAALEGLAKKLKNTATDRETITNDMAGIMSQIRGLQKALGTYFKSADKNIKDHVTDIVTKSETIKEMVAALQKQGHGNKGDNDSSQNANELSEIWSKLLRANILIENKDFKGICSSAERAVVDLAGVISAPPVCINHDYLREKANNLTKELGSPTSFLEKDTKLPNRSEAYPQVKEASDVHGPKIQEIVEALLKQDAGKKGDHPQCENASQDLHMKIVNKLVEIRSTVTSLHQSLEGYGGASEGPLRITCKWVASFAGELRAEILKLYGRNLYMDRDQVKDKFRFLSNHVENLTRSGQELGNKDDKRDVTKLILNSVNETVGKFAEVEKMLQNLLRSSSEPDHLGNGTEE